MVKFAEASQRLFKNVFVCRRCNIKMRGTPQKMISRQIACKNCGCRVFRQIRKIKIAKK